MAKIQFGTTPPYIGVTWEEALGAAREAERLGYHCLWLGDDVLAWDRAPESPIFEAWTTLAALAVQTERAHLGTLVTNQALRNPALLAKMASIVDVLSNGGLRLGMGAGIVEAEHRAYGYRFAPPAERVERLREAVKIVKAMWTGRRATFHGQYYQVEEAFCEPKPVRKPRPPIWIAAGGPKMLRLTAEEADTWNWVLPPSTLSPRSSRPWRGIVRRSGGTSETWASPSGRRSS